MFLIRRWKILGAGIFLQSLSLISDFIYLQDCKSLARWIISFSGLSNIKWTI